MPENVKYKYALYNNAIVSVDDLERDNLEKSDKFYCISCNDELIPKLGKIKRKHFAHKKMVNCSFETYLHKLGKLIFYQEYEKCLKMRNPFILEFYETHICNKKEKELGVKCYLGEKNIKIDLTKYFDKIKIEKRESSFIPDILLYNSRDDKKKLFFEIAVTHKLSESKKNSKYKIIELQVNNENDLACIKKHFISANDKKVRFSNFVIKKKIKNFCNNQCQKKFDLFVVTKQGKSILFDNINLDTISMKLKKISKILQNYEISESFNEFHFYYPQKYKYYVAKKYNEKFLIKNCFICRYHAINLFYSDYSETQPIFCKFLKEQKSSNDAVECNYFKVEKSYVEELINEWLYILEEIKELDNNQQMSYSKKRELLKGKIALRKTKMLEEFLLKEISKNRF